MKPGIISLVGHVINFRFAKGDSGWLIYVYSSRMSQYRRSRLESRFSEYFGYMNTSSQMVGQKILAVFGNVEISAYVLNL